MYGQDVVEQRQPGCDSVSRQANVRYDVKKDAARRGAYRDGTARDACSVYTKELWCDSGQMGTDWGTRKSVVVTMRGCDVQVKVLNFSVPGRVCKI